MARKPRAGALTVLLKDFGKRLHAFREASHYTQEEMAFAIKTNLKDDISVQTIRNWESGRNEPRLEYIQEFARICGVSVDRLIGRIVDVQTEGLKVAETQAEYKVKVGQIITDAINELEQVKENVGLDT